MVGPRFRAYTAGRIIPFEGRGQGDLLNSRCLDPSCACILPISKKIIAVVLARLIE